MKYIILFLWVCSCGIMCNGQYPVTKNYPGDTAMIKVGDTSWMNGTPFVLKSTGSDKLNLYWMQVDTFTPKPLKIKMKPRWKDTGVTIIGKSDGKPAIGIGAPINLSCIFMVSNDSVQSEISRDAEYGKWELSPHPEAAIELLYQYYIQLQKEFMEYKNKHK